ncbi:GNAT family N-acetyltransferase [Enterovibrio calviensis]|uniref:GNAT family N-acetyltransferase n=1 Tax=Enterovibrio calviensis TaxID=91359 RepID=UPI00048A309B|nr:GNAT family N-acetyltransferase [Enterovibrio calviensis]
MTITYEVNRAITVAEFIDVLAHSSLGVRRPLDDMATMEGMVKNADLTVTAWDGDVLVGVSRSITDFHYACYLSDLAVKDAYQGLGIGKTLMQLTNDQLGHHCKLFLISAPAASEYYPKVGFEKNDRAWELPRGKQIG